MKSKYTTAALAFFMGMFGTHRFYLGQRFLGILYGFIFFVCMMITFEENQPAIIFPAILAFVDSVLFAVMPQQEFDERYNRKQVRRRERRDRYYEEAPTRRTQPQALPRHANTLSEYKRSGIEKFRDYDFEGAIEDFLKALEIQPNDPATHFNLACSYSILEAKQAAFEHLEAAITNGFKQYEKIDNHDALSYLRTQPEFEDFVKNGYRVVNQQDAPPAAPEPVTKPEELNDEPKEEPLVLQDDLLDQIIKLGELRDKGILTEEEFAKQKQRILAQR